MTTFEPEDTKIFVCLSTIMTWGTTPIDNVHYHFPFKFLYYIFMF